MTTFSIKECLQFGWDTFKKRPWFFIGFSIIIFLVSALSNILTSSIQSSGGWVAYTLSFVIGLSISLYVSYGQTRVFLRAHDSVEQVRLSDFFEFKNFGMYALLYVCLALAVIAGLILFIVPGIILSLATIFSVYILIDKGYGPIEALKESARITKGHWGKLFLFSLALLGVNLLGFIVLLVGLLVSVPVTLLALLHAYRTLEQLPPKTS
jgi:uncharacterized membrane protein